MDQRLYVSSAIRAVAFALHRVFVIFLVVPIEDDYLRALPDEFQSTYRKDIVIPESDELQKRVGFTAMVDETRVVATPTGVDNGILNCYVAL